MIDPVAILRDARELGANRTLADVEAVLAQIDIEGLQAQERARYRVDVWDKQSPLNGIAPDRILERIPPECRHGAVYLIYVDGNLTLIQPHDPDQAGFVPMDEATALAKANAVVDRLVEQAVDEKVRREAVRRILALLTVTSDKQQVYANGEDTAIITASSPDLKDGDTVTFDIPGVGSVEVTAAGGKAVTTFTTTVPGDWPITASHPTLGSATVLVRGV